MLLLALVLFAPQDWTPPKDADPNQILQEAQRDTRAKRYDDALAKHVWYHENALAISPSQAGVRLSFALSYWKELGQVHPPALDKMKEIRDATEKRLLSDEPKKDRDRRGEFHDVAALDRTLDQFDKTVALFRKISDQDKAQAKALFLMARDAIIAEEEYELAGEFMEVKEEIRRFKQLYEIKQRMPAPAAMRQRLLEIQHKRLLDDCSTLVAILALNGKQEEAKEAAVKCTAIVEDPELAQKLKTAMVSALKGELPEQ